MKARSSKSQKIGIVTKGLVHGSGQKLVIYREFLLGGEIGAEKCVYDILQGRNAFLNYENTKFKKSINLDFYKGVHGFRQKLVIFPDFDFREGGLVQGFRQKLVVFPNVYFRENRP